MSNSTPAAAAAEQQETGAALEKKPHRRGPGPRLAGGSPAARRQAAAILEVLAGVRSPSEAARALGVSTPRYYTLELQALGGLLSACEKRPRGPGNSPERELSRLRREVQRLRRELERSRSLVRAAQRTVGLSAPPAEPQITGKRRRRRQVRALKLAAQLQTPEVALPDAAQPTLAGSAVGSG